MALIRPMTPEDLDAVVQIEQQSQYAPWGRGLFADGFKPRYFNWVCCDNEHIAGFAVVQHLFDEATLLNFAVAVAYRRKGLGQQMLQHVLDHLPEAVHTVLLEVRASNQSARSLYDRVGFNEYATRKGYYPCSDGLWEDAVLMQYARI